MARTILYLVRHGERSTATDGGLSGRGREQAHLLGRRLREVPLHRVHHGSLPRAAQTAQIIAGHLPDATTHPCPWASDLTPVPSPARRHEYPERFHSFLDGVPAEERDPDAHRLRAAVDHFGVIGDEDRHELVVTHNFVIGWFVRHVLDAPVWRWIGLHQDNCALTVVQWESGRPATLVSFNDRGHLR